MNSSGTLVLYTVHSSLGACRVFKKMKMYYIWKVSELLCVNAPDFSSGSILALSAMSLDNLPAISPAAAWYKYPSCFCNS